MPVPALPVAFPISPSSSRRIPDWPGQKALRKHAEEALAAESDAVAAEWFKRYPPVSPTGKIREAEMMMNSGDLEGGAAALRATWIAADFGPLDEKNFLARHSASLRPQDHVQRIDRLLWDGQSEAAHRMLGNLPPDYRLLAEARLALSAQAANAEALVARVPAQLRSDPGLVFEQLRWRRKKDMTDAAVQILLAQRNDLVRPAAWWAERQIDRPTGSRRRQCRTRLSNCRATWPDRRKRVFRRPVPLGYIALRYMKQPALAFEHFSRILTRVSTPYAKSRAGYWGGRAAEAQGKSELATKWYAAGADHMATFYGQLAAHQLGHDAPPHPVPEPVPDAAEHARSSTRTSGSCRPDLLRARRPRPRQGLSACTWRTMRRRRQIRDAGGLAETSGRIDLAIAVAKRAIDAGTPLMIHGYPVTAIPNGGTAEHSLLFAIMRQESAFERDAVSRVGARGLMQLMPATASFIANKMQLPFSADRLTADGVYNVLIGRAYLET